MQLGCIIFLRMVMILINLSSKVLILKKKTLKIILGAAQTKRLFCFVLNILSSYNSSEAVPLSIAAKAICDIM